MFPCIDDFTSKKESIGIVGLGYVGLPMAVLLGQLYQVIGFDIKAERINELINNYDRTGEINLNENTNTGIRFVNHPEELRNTRLIIITVPTPIDNHKLPNLQPLKEATETVGRNLSPGTTVVYESTVYPGVTEEICLPILEQQSGLRSGVDFKVGYSPERINPGDTEHPVKKIVKVVSGQDDETLQLLTAIYGSVIEAGIYSAPDIKTAEAGKVIENIQRDLNIALINELAIIFNQLKIDTQEVLRAAGTKWNFLHFEPGLVGGHCIGVDPYYLTYKAEEIGYHPDVILAGRRTNIGMGKYIADQTVKVLIAKSLPVKDSAALILGFTFKENIRDIRNTRVIDIYRELNQYGVRTYVYDPLASPTEVEDEYGLKLIKNLSDQAPYHAIIIAVKHAEFYNLTLSYLRTIAPDNPVMIDVKAIYDKQEAENCGFTYWRL